MRNINKYIGIYRVFAEVDLITKKASTNLDDTYLKGRYKCQVYRYDNNNLCIYFPSGTSSTNIVLPQFDENDIKYKLYIDCESESVYIVSEKDIDKIHFILKFQIKGKNIQARSKKTAKKLLKLDKNKK